MHTDPTPDTTKSAVLVIDLANDFVHPGGVTADAGGAEYQRRAQGIVPRLARALDAARKAGVTVIYATDAHRPEDSELRKWPPHAMKGTPEADIIETLKPRPTDVVLEKRTYSPCVSTDLDQELRSRGIERLYITGLHGLLRAPHFWGRIPARL